ncbi:MAG: nodulation efficiency protein D [Campylobacteraceae bacterium]|nr:nodulation efficiency protein D [Campylobacteraceae bacterium]
MDQQTLIDVIDIYILLGIGVILIALEVFITSFVLFWFGLGFIICALISKYYQFSDGIWQILVSCAIAFLLLILFRKKVIEKFLQSKEVVNDDFLNEQGTGEIRNSKVYFKGTYWEIDSINPEDVFENGDKVQVIETHKNYAKIKK